MIRWDLTDSEANTLQKAIHLEIERLEHVIASSSKDAKRRESASGRRLELQRLLKGLVRAKESTDNFDIVCYCDTNYDFNSRQLSISYKIGDEESIHQSKVDDVQPPPDEYLGIMEVLEELSNRGIKGRVVIITDASRNALALQMGLRYKVQSHSSNQSPRSAQFGFSYDSTIKMVKALKASGCHVEFRYKHRGYVNEALGIK